MTSSSWMRHRTSASPNCVFSRHWAPTGRTASFSQGDLGQRIFQTPFSWKALGVDVRGRSQTLKLNYRTSHQIRSQADRLLGPEVADVDGNVEDRRGTVSAFNGEPPVIHLFETEQEEGAAVAAWLRERRGPAAWVLREMAIFVRSGKELDRARRAVRGAGFSFQVLDEHLETKVVTAYRSAPCTLAKGIGVPSRCSHGVWGRGSSSTGEDRNRRG